MARVPFSNDFYEKLYQTFSSTGNMTIDTCKLIVTDQEDRCKYCPFNSVDNRKCNIDYYLHESTEMNSMIDYLAEVHPEELI